MQTTTTAQKCFRLLTLLLLSFQGLHAQVVVNEYSAANWQLTPDNYGKHEDWIELYNPGAVPAMIGGWGLTDDETKLQKWQFPAGTLIPEGGYLLVWCSKRNEVANGHFHTNFSLTQTKGNDKIVLSKPGGTIVDAIEVVKTQVHQAWCRTTDGAAIWQVTIEPTPGESNNGSDQFARFAARPVMNLAAGFYTGNQTISITTPEPNAVLRYTLDGTEPTGSSPVYTNPILLDKTTVVKARAFSSDPAVYPSFIEFNTYFINESFSLVVMSVAADDVLELANGNKELRPVGTVEYFDQNKVRKARSYGELNSHGQDSWVNDQRSLDWVSRDEMGYSNAIKEKLFGYSKRDEYQRVILRASGDDNYPGNFLPQHDGCAHIRDEYCQTLALQGGLKLDVRAAERMIVFLNGEYWGVYGLREYPDDSDYTEEYYDQDKYNIQVLETWGNTWAEYGGEKALDDWSELRHFILDNDMSVPANYEHVKDEINLTSMCDYFICGLNFVASDWINYNTAWWRGLNPLGDHKKWGYLLWDFDATFNYYINYSGVPNTEANALPCDIDAISDFVQNQFFGFDNDTCFIFNTDTFCIRADGKHDVIFRKLQEENPEFRQLYYARQADLQNTVFSCDNMLHVLDSMVAVIDPEMTRHAQRWGGSYEGWKQNVQRMRDFISQRCTLLGDGMVNCYDLTGPYDVTLLVQPPGAGDIDFNTIDIEQFPWNGAYFGNMQNKIEANAKGVLPFLRWEVRTGGATIENVNMDSTYVTFAQNDTLVAVFGTSTSTWSPANGIALDVNPTLASDQITVDYSLPESVPVSIALRSLLGQNVLDLPQTEKEGGRHTARLNLQEAKLPSGVYLLDFQAGNQRKSVKVTVVQR